MTVSFRIYCDDGTALPEDQIPSDPAKLQALIGDIDDADGGISVSDEAGGGVMHLGDNLGVLISNFCLKGLLDFKTAGSSQIDFFEHEEIVDLTAEGDEVVATGRRIGTQHFPAKAYFSEQAACGLRYIALLRSLWTGQQEHVAELQGLEEVAGALKALAAP